MKKNYKIVLAFILGILVSGTSVYAATKYLASEVTYKDKTVEKALNELYSKSSSSCDESLVGFSWKYDYSGEEELLVIPCSGTYKLETWGAQGGNSDSKYIGGYGAYSVGNLKIKNGKKIYINVGGQGKVTSSAANQTAKGGYNGGGNSFNKPTTGVIVSGGGGATHIALSSGLLSSLENNKSDILIVSGGGAGSMICPGNSACYSGFHTNIIGHAGGYIGNNSDAYVNGTIQNISSGGLQNGIGENGQNKASFGQGASVNYASDGTPGGGGGYYGGNSSIFSAAGGSSYIGNTLLQEKVMYCYNCEESSEEHIKTISTTNVSDNPTSNYAKKGNGYAKITLISLK